MLLHEQELINLGRTGRKFYGEDFIYEQIRTFTFDIRNYGDLGFDADRFCC